ncbi:hypothetical protein [Saccharopolyspora phatthalungensis]|uniref:Uncharacterized protein n=1 Tax=Saccharopolyspora phatthalungensis TaxID=664693 RepID=A0A840QAA9_9PSEU|nr:hypothetical protein [Saccharopolyspora phatthalungensis]MBB5155499.1 hypothetical protein [Saccharopolyspora phatthalungensis]
MSLEVSEPLVSVGVDEDVAVGLGVVGETGCDGDVCDGRVDAGGAGGRQGPGPGPGGVGVCVGIPVGVSLLGTTCDVVSLVVEDRGDVSLLLIGGGGSSGGGDP